MPQPHACKLPLLQMFNATAAEDLIVKQDEKRGK